MKVIDVQEAKANLERFAEECQSTPIVVTVDGKPAFEMLPVRSDDPDFIDKLIAENEQFAKLLEDRHRETEAGRVVSLEALRQELGLKSCE